MISIKKFIKLSGINQVSWLNPLWLGIIPALIIIWLQPIKFNRFLFNPVETSDFVTWYEDLNQDGINEKIELTTNTAKATGIFYYNNQNKLINQQNISHGIAKPTRKNKPYSVDFDEDGVREIIVFTQNNDSLFLNVFNYAKERIDIENRFVTTIGGLNDKTDYYLNWIGHSDVNNDSIPEFYFSVTGGFALYPRRVFRFDYKKDTLIASINTGAGNLYGTLFHYNDSIAIIASGAAYGNITKSYPYPYHDSTSWLFCFDKDLNLKFPPKSYGSNPGTLGQIFQKDSFIYFIYGANNTTDDKSKLIKMNWRGQVVDSLVFNINVGSTIFNIKIKGEEKHYCMARNNSKFMFIDIDNFGIYSIDKLNFRKKRNLIDQVDLNQDGTLENLFYDYLKRELVLYSDNFKNPFIISAENYIQFLTANYYSNLDYGELILNTADHSIIYQYRNNPNRYLKYPIWFSIYFFSVLFVSVILFLQNRRINKQQLLEQQLADLQLQNLRNQLDPHFTFNVLNTIGSFIYKQDKEKAYDLFQRFTRIIRSSLLVSDKVFRTLSEEIQFTSDYLEFQKIRFKDRFNYSVEIDKNINVQNIQFPKMLIQGFAENAVKHAFHGVDYTGQVTIKIEKANNKLQVIIEDDGIGIKQSKKSKATSGTQKGEQILEEQVRQINKIYDTNYLLLIEDKLQISSQTGTKVTISVSF